MVRIAAAQMRISEDMETNYKRSLDFIRQAAESGAKMVCFPEGQLTHYAPQYKGLKIENIAIKPGHPYISGFCEACRDNNIIASVAVNLEIEGKVYPSMMLISEDGEVLGITKKNHIVYAPHFYESDYFTPGDEGFPVFETSIGKVAQIVCFDRHFPESFRTCALKGADFVVTGVGNEKIEPCEIFRWEILIPAFQNSMNCLMVNRVGVEGNMDFCGESVFAGHDGNIVALADDSECLLLADLDFEAAKKLREEKQYLKLRRPEVFELNGRDCGAFASTADSGSATFDEKYRARFERLSTTNVSDACDFYGISGATCGIRPMAECWGRMVGRAVTVKMCAAGETKNKHHLGMNAIEAAKPGDIIVIDNGGRLDTSCWGGILANSARMKKVSGTVIDGCCRDLDDIIDADYPVYARGCVVATARGRIMEQSTNEIISFGGVQVRPGDVVMCDRSGVVIVPWEHVDEVLEKAEELYYKEEQMVKEILESGDLLGTDEKFGYEKMLKNEKGVIS